MPKGCRLRKGRVSESGRAYILTTVTHGREPWFADFNMGRVVARSIGRYPDAGWCNNLAWVVMPDHLHWLLVLGERGRLNELMRSFKGYTARALNEHMQRKGKPFWQSGYHDHAVRRDEDLRKLARYIIGNPLRAGLVEDMGQYPLWDAAWL
jgi:putative transposase